MVSPRRLAAALSSLSARAVLAVVVPVAIVAVVIATSFCVVLPLACARLRAKKKGRPRRTGAALVDGDVL